MIALLPWFRFPRWRRMASSGAPDGLRRPETVQPPTETSPPSRAPHRPPQPRNRADLCACGNPIGESVSGDWCSPTCHATYLATQGEPIYATCPVPNLPPRLPQPPLDPPWLAAWSEWDRKKAAALVETRKAPA